MATYYFTEEGSYGAADSVAILDTTKWTAADWQEIDAAADSDRLGIALSIAARTNA
jgi:hypothetical protein